MPLGDSITWGYQSSDGNGFRNTLYQALANEGHQVDFVGSVQSGNMADPDNEGWPGYVIADISGKAQASVPGLLPNIYTVDAGVNDCNTNVDVGNAGSRLDALIQNLWSMTPDATIVFTTLTVNGAGGGLEDNVQNVNGQYRSLYQTYQGQGKRVILVELHDGDNALQFPADFADDLHPNDQGYAKLGNLLFAGVQAAEAAGFIVAPQ